MRRKRASLRIKNGQSFIQYVILIFVASAAIIAMTAYLMRSVNARLKQEKNEVYYYSKER